MDIIVVEANINLSSLKIELKTESKFISYVDAEKYLTEKGYTFYSVTPNRKDGVIALYKGTISKDKIFGSSAYIRLQ